MEIQDKAQVKAQTESIEIETVSAEEFKAAKPINAFAAFQSKRRYSRESGGAFNV